VRWNNGFREYAAVPDQGFEEGNRVRQEAGELAVPGKPSRLAKTSPGGCVRPFGFEILSLSSTSPCQAFPVFAMGWTDPGYRILNSPVSKFQKRFWLQGGRFFQGRVWVRRLTVRKGLERPPFGLAEGEKRMQKDFY